MIILYYIYTVIATLTVIASWDLHGTSGRTLLVLAAVAPTFVKMFNYEPEFEPYTYDPRAWDDDSYDLIPYDFSANGCTDPKTSSRKAESFLSDFYEWCDENGYSQDERPMVFQEWANEN
jgi:hypothetical protein